MNPRRGRAMRRGSQHGPERTCTEGMTRVDSGGHTQGLERAFVRCVLRDDQVSLHLDCR